MKQNYQQQSRPAGILMHGPDPYADAAPDSAGLFSHGGSPDANADEANLSTPVSSVMTATTDVIGAEDSIEQVELELARLSASAIAVLGSNGLIVGVIGPHELAQCHADKKNVKAVRAWEVSRCTVFEVHPYDTVSRVAAIMAENKIDYIAVTENGALQGMVSVLNLVPVMLNQRVPEAGAD